MKISKREKELLCLLAKNSRALLPVAAGACAFSVDQTLKSSVELREDAGFPAAVLKKSDAVELRKMHNPGFVFGLGKDHPELSEAVPVAAVGVAAGAYAVKPKKSLAGNIGAGLLLGGALSNIYDRKKRGYVVDYIHVKKGPLGKIVFNVGDAAIAIGAILSNF